MNRLERFHRIDRMLRSRGAVPRQVFLDELDVSVATFKRDIEYLRDRLDAPLVWDRDAGGYRYEIEPGRGGPAFTLPGPWFDEREAYALLTMQRLLESLDRGGLIGVHVEPLKARLDALLSEGEGEGPAREIGRRVRLLSTTTRTTRSEHFETVGAALVKRRRIDIVHHARASDETTRREVSPQRLLHYGDKWYLGAWCHLRGALRVFAVDSIVEARMLGELADDVEEAALDRALGADDGILEVASDT